MSPVSIYQGYLVISASEDDSSAGSLLIQINSNINSEIGQVRCLADRRGLYEHEILINREWLVLLKMLITLDYTLSPENCKICSALLRFIGGFVGGEWMQMWQSRRLQQELSNKARRLLD